MQTIITVKNVYKTYKVNKEEIEVLKGINLNIEKGEFAAFIGPSGSGKSTLLHLLGAMESPSSGEIILNGHHLNNINNKKRTDIRCRDIGFIFQTFNLLPNYTSIENVEIALFLAGINAKERRRKAMELLDLVGLKDRLRHLPNQLSGGQRQRVAIARALANNPTLLLADEPTGNLDTETGEKVIDLLIDINHRGQTLLMVTHNNDLANRAHRIINIKDGKIDY